MVYMDSFFSSFKRETRSIESGEEKWFPTNEVLIIREPKTAISPMALVTAYLDLGKIKEDSELFVRCPLNTTLVLKFTT